MYKILSVRHKTIRIRLFGGSFGCRCFLSLFPDYRKEKTPDRIGPKFRYDIEREHQFNFSRLLYADGVSPICAWKMRLKYCGSV